ncbi:MAG: AlpA family phage regulatory protein [Comamonadaceae bacterium]|nr:MAG: AlpA family phage regulatory protein [Comamonadaceae bacterium]
MLSNHQSDVHLPTATHYSQEISKAVSAASTFDSLPASGYIRQAQLIPGIVPFSSATLWRKCKAGHFPKPVKLSERVTAWNVGSVRAFLDAQAKGVSK